MLVGDSQIALVIFDASESHGSAPAPQEGRVEQTRGTIGESTTPSWGKHAGRGHWGAVSAAFRAVKQNPRADP